MYGLHVHVVTTLTEYLSPNQLRRNIPCHISDVSCGSQCRRGLPCGTHRCVRTCHKGVCLEKIEDCRQPTLAVHYKYGIVVNYSEVLGSPNLKG